MIIGATFSFSSNRSTAELKSRPSSKRSGKGWYQNSKLGIKNSNTLKKRSLNKKELESTLWSGNFLKSNQKQKSWCENSANRRRNNQSRKTLFALYRSPKRASVRKTLATSSTTTILTFFLWSATCKFKLFSKASAPPCQPFAELDPLNK